VCEYLVDCAVGSPGLEVHYGRAIRAVRCQYEIRCRIYHYAIGPEFETEKALDDDHILRLGRRDLRPDVVAVDEVLEDSFELRARAAEGLRGRPFSVEDLL